MIKLPNIIEVFVKDRRKTQGIVSEVRKRYFKTEKFMTWWIKSVAELIQHWYSIEENISSSVLTKEGNKS